MKTDTKRRDFLKASALAAIALATNPLKLQADEENTDYQAIVVLYHAGGNDSLNMFIPCSDDEKKGYPNYNNIRNNIKVADEELSLSYDSDGNLDLSGGNPYDVDGTLPSAYTKGFYKHTLNGNTLDVATNALMPELADLINKGKVAIVSNCGNLIEPATKEELLSEQKPLPPFLYAHNHQTKLMFNAEAALLDYTGWAGRVYDMWQDINNGDIYGMNISFGGVTHLFDGNTTSPLILSPNGPTQYTRLDRDMYDNYMALQRNNIFQNYYNNIRKHSFDMQDVIVDDWNNNAPDLSSVLNAYGTPIFTLPSSEDLQQGSVSVDDNLLKQLSAVVRLAYIGKNRGLKKEIFFVYDGGYDTHNDQATQHSKKLRGLSLSLGDYYKALEALGMQDQVTLLSCSDFGRSTGNNDDGTDHAWGGSYFVLGGAVKGGLYGELPDLTLGSDDDITQKGRLIPTTSYTQYYATVLKWFGVTDNELDLLLPELKNFAVKDLEFMS